MIPATMMCVIRIGVVADTHCPEFLEELPHGLFERLHGVDLILHAGDVGGPGGVATLDRLREIAPVEAVRGDHDRGLSGLPRTRVVNVSGRRIGLIHGNRSRPLEEATTLVATLGLGLIAPRGRQERWVRRQFHDVDVIVYGHTHHAAATEMDGVLVFNPGAVYQVTPYEAGRRLGRRPGWFEWCWLQVIRHRRDRPVSSIGILELGERVSARVLPVG